MKEAEAAAAAAHAAASAAAAAAGGGRVSRPAPVVDEVDVQTRFTAFVAAVWALCQGSFTAQDLIHKCIKTWFKDVDETQVAAFLVDLSDSLPLAPSTAPGGPANSALSTAIVAVVREQMQEAAAINVVRANEAAAAAAAAVAAAAASAASASKASSSDSTAGPAPFSNARSQLGSTILSSAPSLAATLQKEIEEERKRLRELEKTRAEQRAAAAAVAAVAAATAASEAEAARKEQIASQKPWAAAKTGTERKGPEADAVEPAPASASAAPPSFAQSRSSSGWGSAGDSSSTSSSALPPGFNSSDFPSLGGGKPAVAQSAGPRGDKGARDDGDIPDIDDVSSFQATLRSAAMLGDIVSGAQLTLFLLETVSTELVVRSGDIQKAAAAARESYLSSGLRGDGKRALRNALSATGLSTCLLWPGLRELKVSDDVRNKLKEVVDAFARGGNKIQAVSTGRNRQFLESFLAAMSNFDRFAMYVYLHTMMTRLCSKDVIGTALSQRQARMKASESAFGGSE